MRNTFSRDRGTARCQYEIAPGRQLVLRVGGVITATVMPHLIDDLERIAGGMLAKSLVVNYTGALVALTQQQILSIPDQAPDALKTLPIAIVSPPGVTDLFREYAWATAKLGLLRGVFREEEPGQAWSQEMGAVAPALYSRIREAG